MRFVFVSDIHFPDHDQRAWKLFLKIIPDLNIDGIYWGGDIIDVAPLSRWPKRPDERMRMAEEIRSTHDSLGEVANLVPSAWHEYKQGNHEARIEKFKLEKVPELWDLPELTIPRLLRLDDLGIDWIPEEEVSQIGQLFLLHGHEIKAGSANPAKSLFNKVNQNLMVGHFHRFDSYGQRQFGGDSHRVWVNGTLQVLNPGYVFFPQWTQGFSIIDVLKCGLFKVEPIEFFWTKTKICTIINGQLYEA